jgi:tRNA threonylcarbamoyladenosine modification (KEOPS) complex  Pcc1 subunit
VTTEPSPWTAQIRVHRPDRESATHLERTLLPEAAREVPRSRATLSRPDDRTVLLEVEAQDTGALRAALNAYLGWVRLALETEGVAERTSGRGPADAASP